MFSGRAIVSRHPASRSVHVRCAYRRVRARLRSLAGALALVALPAWAVPSDQAALLFGASAVLLTITLASIGLAVRQFRDAREHSRLREERVEVLFELSVDWIWEQDADLRFTFIASGPRARHPVNAEYIVGKLPWELVYLHDHNDWDAYRAMCARRAPYQDFELLRMAEGQEPQWIAISGLPRYDDEGRFAGYRGISRDITAQKRAERALIEHRDSLQREVEQRTAQLEALFDASPLGMAHVIDRRFVRVNPALQELFRYTAEEMEGQSTRLIFESDEAFLEVGERIRPVTRTGRTHVVESSYRRRDGAVFRGRAYGRALQPDRPDRGQMWLYEDITQQRQAEEALAASKAAYEEASALAHFGFWRRDLSIDEHVWSPELFRISGLDPAGGVPSFDVFLSLVHPADQDKVYRLAALACEQGYAYEYGYRIVRPDGELRYLHDRNIPLFDAQGVAIGQFGTTQDQTSIYLAERAVQQSQEAYEETSRLAHIGHWRWEWETGALTWSREIYEIHGFDPNGPPPDFEQLMERIHPEDVERWFRLAALGIEQGYSTDIGYRIVLPGGTVRYIFERNAPLYDETGRLIGQFGYSQDETESYFTQEALRRAKEDAERANRAKSEFLANMSHELRTPMHAILSFADLGVERVEQANPVKLKHYFDNIRLAGRRLLALLNDLLDLSKLEAGKMQYQLTVQPLLPVMRDALNELRPLAQTRQQQIILEAEVPERLSLDALRIGQVVRNLIGNALKFSPVGGVVRVGFERGTVPGTGEPALIVRIADEGIGIPAEELETVFEKFIQSSTTKSSAGGTGLGLAICREIVRAHHGAIWAANNPNGSGSVFRFALPMPREG